MIKSYFKIAVRNLRNKLTFSIINITGLAVGMAGAILIFIWVQNEYSFDNFHAHKNDLYKVFNRTVPPGEIFTSDVTASLLGKTLKDDYPEVKNTARVYWTMNRLFNYGDKSIKAKGNDVDQPFLSMFSFPLLEGNAEHALDEVHSVVITSTLAKKIFADADPINKLVKINNKELYKVTGVLKDLPNNTQFDFDYLVALPAGGVNPYGGMDWGESDFNTYVQLQPGADINKVNAKIRNVVTRHAPTYKQDEFLYPLTNMRLYANFENGLPVGGRIATVRLLLAIAGIILLIACINFMNLSTAQSQKRAREVGVRKVMGASRLWLAGQFLSESLLIVALSGVIALVLVKLCLPAFNQLTEKQLDLNFADPLFWMAFSGFILFTGLLAGSYPAFLLSGFRPVKVLKGTLANTGSFFNPRKVLVVLQFSVAIILVVATIVVYRQIRFGQDRGTGYNINNLAEVRIEGDIKKNFDLIKNELINSGAATAVCRTSLDVTVDGSRAGGLNWDGITDDQRKLVFSMFGTSGDFVKTMGLKLIDGRDIDFAAYPSDSAACMLNESAVTQMGLAHPVGKVIHNGNLSYTVVGVFKDFIIESPYVNVNPMLVQGSKTWAHNTVIRLNPAKGIPVSLQLAGGIFKKYNPAYPFTFQFADKEYQEKFNDQQQTGSLAFVFAGLTIFISCLGLFGLASFMAENRSKEIGIRKVLGASVASITTMLTREFVSLVIIAIVIAMPVAWWAASKWLQDFTYRIQIGWLTFVLAGGVAIVIAVITVSSQSVKAALTNPVKSIKAE